MASTHALAACRACIFALNCLVEGKSHTLNARANAICISSSSSSSAIVVSSCWNAFGLTVDKRHEYWVLSTACWAHSRPSPHSHTHTLRSSRQQRNLQWLQKPSKSSALSLSQLKCSSAEWWLCDVGDVFFLLFFCWIVKGLIAHTCCWRLCIIYDLFCNCPILCLHPAKT